MTPLQKLKYKKLQKKYSGTEWKYISVDYTGEVCMYKTKPRRLATSWVPTETWSKGPESKWLKVHEFDTKIEDWQDTLVKL